MPKKFFLLFMLVVVVMGFTGCDFITDTEVYNGQGELVLNIADRPFNEIDKVLVTIDEVQVNLQGDSWEVINDFADEDGEKEFDLMELRFDKALLGQETLEVGEYNQIRLIIAADVEEEEQTSRGKSRVVYDDGVEKDIFIPSGMQTGLKINHQFTIEEDVITELTLDVDIRDLMHAAGDSELIILRPTAIRVIDEVVSGNIYGQVLGATNEDSQDEEPITEQDVVIEAYAADEENNEELVGSTYALSEPENDREAGEFMLRGLVEGSYNLKVFVVDEEDEMDNSKYEANWLQDVEVVAGEDKELEEEIILPLVDEDNSNGEEEENEE